MTNRPINNLLELRRLIAIINYDLPNTDDEIRLRCFICELDTEIHNYLFRLNQQKNND
jgi:hypothetical protein